MNNIQTKIGIDNACAPAPEDSAYHQGTYIAPDEPEHSPFFFSVFSQFIHLIWTTTRDAPNPEDKNSGKRTVIKLVTALQANVVKIKGYCSASAGFLTNKNIKTKQIIREPLVIIHG